MTQTTRYPCALTIAGSDPSGGAGLQADLKTFTAHGVYGAAVITAVTAQNSGGVRAVHPLPPAIVAAQLAAVLEDIPFTAVKIGMLATAEIIAVVAEQLRLHPPPAFVLDPVMLSTSGHPLLLPDAVDILRKHLLPFATLITPNLPEAAVLLACEAIADPSEAARELLALGAGAVLLKGGHASGEELVDVLLTRERTEPHLYHHRRLDTPHTHGTGCALSAAIAARLARGVPLIEAVEGAIAWLQQAIALAWPPGQGPGPVHHCWQLWPMVDGQSNI